MTTYRRQYRSTPREIAIRDGELAKALAMVAGFVTLLMMIAFA